MKQCFLAFQLLVLTTGACLAQMTPDAALKSFTVADGLQLQLFASEPMFVNPTCIDVDHKGRVWVCESVNYRCDLRKVKRNRAEGDRLVVLEDADGDGKADKAHTFYQEKDFIAPLGVAVAPNPDGKGQKVYVCHSPHIYVFEDSDGDLKADGPPKALLTGFRGYDHDHGVHGIHFGPDGKLYFSVGDAGVEKLKSAGGNASAPRAWTSNSTDCRAGTVWRCDADGANLELIAHNFRNQYEPAVDSFGAIFVSDNDDDGNQQTRICYVMPGGNYGYHPRGKGESHWHEEQPGIVHKVLRTGFGSPTGLCWYEGKTLVEPLQTLGKQAATPATANLPIYGLLLHTDAGPREVRCFVVRARGAGFELDKINLLTSTDNWFRPSDVCVAPDGSLFVSDWYDPGVGGHGMGDTTRGRIYRLTAKGREGYKVPPIDLATDEGLRAAFLSPNLDARHGAYLALQRKSPAELAAWADKLAENDNGLPASAREGWLRSATPAFAEELRKTYAPLLDKPDAELATSLRKVVEAPLYRAHSPFVLMARILRDRYGSPAQAPDTIRKFYLRLAQQLDHPATGRELLLALKDAPPEVAKEWIEALMSHYDGQDRFYLAAINIAVGNDPKRREIILADFEKRIPEWNDKVAKLVWELRPPAVIARLDQKLADASLTSEQKGFILEILANTDAQAGARLLALLQDDSLSRELRAQVVRILASNLPTRWKSLQGEPAIKAVARKLLGEESTQALGIQLITASESPELAESLVDLANSDGAALESRRAAVTALGQFRSDRFVIELANLADQRDLQRVAIAALGKVGHARAVALLEEMFKDERRPLAVRVLAVTAAAESRPGSQRLLQLHEQKQLPQALLADAGQVLRNSPYQDLRNKALVAFPAPGKMDLNKLPDIAKLVPRTGNPKHGRELLAVKELGCVRCHTIRGVGGNVGPDLSMIGKKASRENLFESILYPDKAIADQFIQHMILDRGGVTVTGLLVEETPEHVVIRDGLAKDHKIAKDDIENRGKSKKSIMPSDLIPFLSEQDLVDIVTYLETLKTPTLSVDAWNILGPFDNGSGDVGLEKPFPPEKLLLDGQAKGRPIDPNAEYDGKYGKVKRRIVRPNGEGYVDLAGLYGSQSSQTVSYLWKEIDSPIEQDATILIGADDGCKLFVNGKEVLSHTRHEAAQPERDRVPIRLQAGRNRVVLKINNGDGPHGFYFAVLSQEELRNFRD